MRDAAIKHCKEDQELPAWIVDKLERERRERESEGERPSLRIEAPRPMPEHDAPTDAPTGGVVIVIDL